MTMSVETWSTIVGTGGALWTTFSFLPQLVSVKRHGGRDLSLTMLAMYLVGSLLWLVYGVLNDAAAVIAANVVAITLVSAIVVMKVAADRRAAGSPRRLRIAIDMDEVMADALSEHLTRYNAAFGAALTAGDLRGRHLEDSVPAERRQAAVDMIDGSFFKDLAVLPDCQEVIAELAARHEVVIASAAMEVPCSFDAKYRWLERHFPFTAAHLAVRSPVVGVLRDGAIVAICMSCRDRPDAGEAGLYTVEAYRGQGFPRPLVARWRMAMDSAGRTPYYSTTWDNAASLAVARGLTLEPFAEELAIA